MDWYKLISIIVRAIKTPSQKLPCFSGHFSNLGQENCCNAFQRIAKLCVCDGMSLDPRKCHSKHCRHPRWWEKGGVTSSGIKSIAGYSCHSGKNFPSCDDIMLSRCFKIHLVVFTYCARVDACGRNMVPRGLEPRTLRLLAVHSNQLSYETN